MINNNLQKNIFIEKPEETFAVYIIGRLILQIMGVKSTAPLKA